MLPDALQLALCNYVEGTKVPAARSFLKKNLHSILLRYRKDLVSCEGSNYTVVVSNRTALVTVAGDTFEIKT